MASGDRGAYFLQTQFTYDDLTREGKVGFEDYNWKTTGFEEFDGHPCYVLEGIPVDQETAEELGYGKVVSHVDTQNWVIRESRYFDVRGNPLKVFKASDIRQVQGIWTTHRAEVENLKDGRRTVFKVSDVDYSRDLRDDLFDQRTLSRGIR